MNKGNDDTNPRDGKRKFNAGDVLSKQELLRRPCSHVNLPIRDMKSDYNSYLPIACCYGLSSARRGVKLKN
jgi:hypothetical protein